MTLFRQIALLKSLVFILLLGVVAWNDFRQSSHFLQGQLHTAAQDMATTLGVTVAEAARKDDMASVEALFNAVFDSGYYSSLTLTSKGGEVMQAKSQPLKVQGVPEWFTEFVPLQPAQGQTSVMRGWLPWGTLSVTMHPGFVYASLYQNFQSMLRWFSFVAILGLGALWGLLNWLMRPLSTVRYQAEAIQENRFIRHEPLPKTRELRHVSEAMNSMVGKAQMVLDEQSETLNRYHELLYRDPLTGLGNRRYFMMRLGAMCRDDGAAPGWLVMLHFEGLAEMNQCLGHRATDEMIVNFSELLERELDESDAESCYRVKPSEFAVYVPGTSDSAAVYVDRVFEGFRQLNKLDGDQDYRWICAGITPVEPGCQANVVLSDVDFALMQAKSRGANGTFRQEHHEPNLPQGKMQWRSWLEKSLLEGRFFLVGQTVRNTDDSLHHRELFVRLRDEQQRVIPAGVFMPVASSLGLAFAIDKAVFGMALDLSEEESPVPIALNLSDAFLSSADALSEFNRFLKAYMGATRAALCVEVSHFDLLHHSETALHIGDQLRAAGFAFGVDRLDLGSSLQPLQAVRPHYVKVRARQVADMAEDRIQVGFQALRTLADSLDFRLIAVGVDSEELRERMEALGITTMQGNYLAAPEELT